MNRFFILLTVTVFMACGNSGQQSSTAASNIDQKELKSELDQLEKTLQTSQSTELDKATAKTLIEKSVQYIDAFPKDEWSPKYLFRTGEVCVGIKEYKRAIDYWERLINDYSTHEKAPIALFLQGFTCDNQMKDIESAKKYYNAFLKKHPNHEYAKQVVELVKNIDISPEDLIKAFQKKRAAEEE